MSESQRTVETIDAEYRVVATRAGHIQYQLSALNKELALVNEAMVGLNTEVAKLEKKEGSEERTLESIQNDYQLCCIKAGHLTFQATLLNKSLELEHAGMNKLSEEARALPPVAPKTEESTTAS